MIQLSIIVPVYNKVKYLDECIRSILNQTFSDFELILVNDGSIDGSDLVCQKHANLDQRISVINQQNAGVSAARNAGLKIAKGRFIGFVDSDDTIRKDMYELLIRNIEMYDADISVCRLQTVSASKTQHPKEQSGAFVLDHIRGLKASLNGELDRSANNKIYKNQLACGEKFEGSINEDILYTNKIFMKAKKTVVENIVKYNYMIRDNSASMQTFNDTYIQMVDTSSTIVRLVAKETPGCINEARAYDIATNLALLNLLIMAETSSKSILYSQVMANITSQTIFINSTKLLTWKQRYALKAFLFSPKLYKSLLRLYCLITQPDLIKRTNSLSNES